MTREKPIRHDMFIVASPMGRFCTYVNAEAVSGCIIFYPVFSNELLVQEKIQKDLELYLDSQVAEYIEYGGLVPLAPFDVFDVFDVSNSNEGEEN